MRGQIGEEWGKYFHFGNTSQDVLDTSSLMRTARALNYILQRIEKLFEQLASLSDQFGDGILIGRTRMQRALPIKVKDRITSWQEGILDAQLKIVHCELSIQLGGRTGNLEAFGKNAKALKIALAKHLNTVAKKTIAKIYAERP